VAQRILEPAEVLRARPGAGDGRRAPSGNGGGGSGGSGGAGAASPPASRVGLWFFLVAVTMLFIAFTVAYASRRTAPDWSGFTLPRILWLNSGVLLAGSGVLEWARRRLQRGDAAGLRRGLLLATALGVAFLVGQVSAWRDLAAAGVFMASSPHSAFFYLLTAVHGLHLLGGLGALGYTLRRLGTTPAPVPAAGTGGELAAGAAATTANLALYWHFLTALWLYVFVILLS
jgi:cytochrome c oxidase subunit 3